MTIKFKPLPLNEFEILGTCHIKEDVNNGLQLLSYCPSVPRPCTVIRSPPCVMLVKKIQCQYEIFL